VARLLGWPWNFLSPVMAIDRPTDRSGPKAAARSGPDPIPDTDESIAPGPTVIERFARWARDEPDRSAFTFAGREHTFGALWAASGQVARALGSSPGESPDRPRDHAPTEQHGERIVLVLPNGPDFFAAFFGAQRAGAVPVPIFPQSGVERIAHIAGLSGASRVILDPDTPPETLAAVHARLDAQRTDDGSRPTVVAGLEALAPPGPAGPSDEPDPAADALPADLADRTAFLQYTSGSTGAPKGVVITHETLRVNVLQMIEGMEITPEDVFVSWLPVHHDMGLILMTMVPFFLGARLVLLPSSLGDVRTWLRAIADHRGTFTAAPDFAYRLCVRAVRDPSGFDLSSLRVALDAAEPVRATTISRFEEAFGLDRVVVAGYGLAEATVGVSMQPPGTAPAVTPRGLVAIGRPFPGVRLRIVTAAETGATDARGDELGSSDGREETGAPDAAELTEPGTIGEIVVESPAVTPGYFRDDDATAALFWRGDPNRDPSRERREADPPPGDTTGTTDEIRAIRTGDLGFRDAAGHVYIVGRSKNIILQAGRNLAPQEIEEAVEALPFVRRAAAVGIDRGGLEGEQAYVFAELRRARPPSEERLHEMAADLVARIHERLGLRPGRVFLLTPRSIPRTANGKLRYPALRATFLDGSLAKRIVFPRS